MAETKQDEKGSSKQAEGQPAPKQQGGASATPSGDKADLNSASADDLVKCVEGLSGDLARRIVEHRDKKGGFGNLEELKQVEGVGEDILHAFRRSASVKKAA